MKAPTRGEVARSWHTLYAEMGTCVSGDKAATARNCRYARQCDPREEPDALVRTSRSVRGARGTPGPYRADAVTGKFEFRIVRAEFAFAETGYFPLRRDAVMAEHAMSHFPHARITKALTRFMHSSPPPLIL